MECTQCLQDSVWDSLQAGHPEEHNRILTENIRELDKMGYGAVADKFNEIVEQKKSLED